MNRTTKKFNSDKEWEIIKFETRHNKPLIGGPYPENIVRRRELLLFAQNFLSKYQVAKSKKYKSFFVALYKTTMDTYFSW